MNEQKNVDAELSETAQIIRAIDDMFDKIEQLNRRMQQNRPEIDRLRSETKEILKDLKVKA